MGASIYGNVSGANRKAKELYAKVNGVSRKIKGEYAKVNGVVRKVYSGAITVTTSGFKLDCPNGDLSARELFGTLHDGRKCCLYAHYNPAYYDSDGHKLYLTFNFSDPVSFNTNSCLWVHDAFDKLWEGDADKKAFSTGLFKFYNSAGALLYSISTLNYEGEHAHPFTEAITNVKSIQSILTLSKRDRLEYEAYIAFGIYYTWPGNVQTLYDGAELKTE